MPQPRLIACFDFEDTLEDGSGHANHLAGEDLGFTAGVGGEGRALSLGEGSQVAGPGSTPSLDFSQALTVEVWIRPDSSQTRWLVDHDNQWGIQLLAGGPISCLVVVDDGGGGAVLAVGGGSAPPAQWTHLACTYDRQNLILYQDGVEIDQANGGGEPIYTASTGGFVVGQDAPAGDPFLGTIDRVRVWSEARSANEIGESYRE